MEPLDAIEHMMRTANIGPVELSRRMGKSRGYVSSLINRGSIPNTDTLTRIAHECGYRIVAQGERDSFELYTEADNERRLRRMLEERPEDDGAPETKDVSVTPTPDDIARAYREGRFRMVDGQIVVEPEDGSPSE